MHCVPVAARTRCRQALTTDNHNVKQSTTTNNPASDDADDQDDVAVSNDDSDSDSEGQFVCEATTNEERNEGERRRRGRKPTKTVEIGGVKRRKAFGLDILIDENASQERKSAAQRTRSHFHRNYKNKNLKLGMGTIAKPICINDDDEEGEEKEADDLDDDDHTQEEASGSESDEDEANGSESDEQKSNFYKRKVHACVQNKEKLATKKHKKQHFNVIKILKDSIYGNVKGEVPLEEARDQEPQPNPCMDLPIKFSFSRQGPKEAEESEQDKELELLWAEYDRALHASADSWVSDHKREPSAHPRKKHIHGDPKDFGVLNIPRDSITGEGEVHVEEAIDNELSPIMDLPLKFSFAREEPKPLEKSEEEKQLDQLWAEMDFALYATQDNSSPASQVTHTLYLLPSSAKLSCL